MLYHIYIYVDFSEVTYYLHSQLCEVKDRTAIHLSGLANTTNF